MQLLSASLASYQTVSLADVLCARDMRQALQQLWRDRFGCPQLSFSTLAPGEVKDSALTRRIFNLGWQSLQNLINEKALPVMAQSLNATPLGGYGLIALDVDAAQLKAWLMALEEEHPLGRLWDLDVIGTDGRPLSREALGGSPRRCLICARPAHECARARRHSVETLLAQMEEMVDACCPR